MTRRKDIGAPDQLMLEPELERRDTRRKLTSMLAMFVVVSALEGLAVGWPMGLPWLAVVTAALAVAYVGAARRLGGAWIRRALAAEAARNPRLNRLVRSVSKAAGIGDCAALITRGEGINAFAVGLGPPAVVATTGSLNVDDLVLEGVVAQAAVRIRDGDAALQSTYVALAGGPQLLRRNLATAHGPVLLAGLVLWPAALVVRAARPALFAPGDLHRADIAAALLTRYPPGIERALRDAKPPPPLLGCAEPFWFSSGAEPRADLVGEM